MKFDELTAQFIKNFRKNIENFEKPLDKEMLKCYNKGTVKEIKQNG